MGEALEGLLNEGREGEHQLLRKISETITDLFLHFALQDIVTCVLNKQRPLSSWEINLLSQRATKYTSDGKEFSIFPADPKETSIPDTLTEQFREDGRLLFFHGTTFQSAVSVSLDGVDMRLVRTQMLGPGFYVWNKLRYAINWMRSVCSYSEAQYGAVIVFSVKSTDYEVLRLKDIRQQEEWESVVKGYLREDHVDESGKVRFMPTLHRQFDVLVARNCYNASSVRSYSGNPEADRDREKIVFNFCSYKAFELLDASLKTVIYYWDN